MLCRANFYDLCSSARFNNSFKLINIVPRLIENKLKTRHLKDISYVVEKSYLSFEYLRGPFNSPGGQHLTLGPPFDMPLNFKLSEI